MGLLARISKIKQKLAFTVNHEDIDIIAVETKFRIPKKNNYVDVEFEEINDDCDEKFLTIDYICRKYNVGKKYVNTLFIDGKIKGKRKNSKIMIEECSLKHILLNLK